MAVLVTPCTTVCGPFHVPGYPVHVLPGTSKSTGYMLSRVPFRTSLWACPGYNCTCYPGYICTGYMLSRVKKNDRVIGQVGSEVLSIQFLYSITTRVQLYRVQLYPWIATTGVQIAALVPCRYPGMHTWMFPSHKLDSSNKNCMHISSTGTWVPRYHSDTG